MDFKFGFFDNVAATESLDSTKFEIAVDSAVVPSKKLTVSDVWSPVLALPREIYSLPNGKDICYLHGTSVEKLVMRSAGNQDAIAIDEAVLKALSDNKDVVSGVIEGGFTVWDGTGHLIKHLAFLTVDFDGKRVLDLGCGGGLLGLYALINGASKVVFQEYNEVVLKTWTIPNVILSFPEVVDKEQRVSFFSGDWHNLSETWQQQADHQFRNFDIILTAEVIYRPELYSKLHEILSTALKPSPNEDAEVFLVSKAQYYGIGGNVYDFSAFLDSKRVFSHTSTQLTHSGISYVCIRLKRI